ncbi:hypothetical protein ACI2IX_17810 [Leifsonia aquatica]|uniref:hypothetical protein n=1 Tax=Leifsonia aquatica TaxID=144185 RepID=UPI00384B84C4
MSIARTGEPDREKIRLSVAIMTHPRRRERAEEIAASVRTDLVRVVTDPDPSGAPTAWRTACRAWSSAPSAATHHLVLQDDVELSRLFIERVQSAIELHPEHALSFFADWGSRTASAIRVGLLSGAAWAPVLDDYIPTQALVLPAAVANGFEAYARASTTEADPDDVVMLNYLRSSGISSAVSTHHLVDHDVIPSIVGNDEKGARRATNFANEPSEGEVEGGDIQLDAAPFMSWSTRELSLLTRVSGETSWRREPLAVTIEAAIGLPFDQVDGAANAVLARHGLPHPELGVTAKHAWSLSVIAAISGFLSQGPVPTYRLARDSMKTLAGGALRKVVDIANLDSINEALLPSLADAALTGRAWKVDQ